MRFRARATSNSARRGPPMKPSPMAGWTSGSEEGCGMGIIEGVIGPLGKLIDRVIPDPEARDRAKLARIRLEGSQAREALKKQLKTEERRGGKEGVGQVRAGGTGERAKK